MGHSTVTNLDSVISNFDPTDPRMFSVPGMTATLLRPRRELAELGTHVMLLAEKCESTPGDTDYYKVTTDIDAGICHPRSRLIHKCTPSNARRVA
jgi:hypothetical protein